MTRSESSDISRGTAKALFGLGLACWVMYFASLLPASSVGPLGSGGLAGLFVGALVYGTIAAGCSVWLTLRCWGRVGILAMLISLPLAGLCWWRALTWAEIVRP